MEFTHSISQLDTERFFLFFTFCISDCAKTVPLLLCEWSGAQGAPLHSQQYENEIHSIEIMIVAEKQGVTKSFEVNM